MSTAGDGYVLALTYGPDTDWVKNVLAAGGCELRMRGQAFSSHHRACTTTRTAQESTRSSGRACGSYASPTSCS